MVDGRGDLEKPLTLDQNNKRMRAESDEKLSVQGETTISASKNPISQELHCSGSRSRSGSESGDQLLSESVKDPEEREKGCMLHRFFLEWAKKHNKTYKSEEEQDKRFKLWCCYKEEVDPYMAHDNIDRMYWFADLTHLEKRLNLGSCSQSKRSSSPTSDPTSPTPGLRSRSKRSSSPTPGLYSRSKGSKRSRAHAHNMRAEGSVDSLRKTFLEWANKHDKRYENREEEERRFKIWCTYKEGVDPYTKRDGIDRMYWFADMTKSEKSRQLGGEKVPDKYEERRLAYLDRTNDERMEYVKKTKREFREWAERHKRNYGSKMEENTRFGAYLTNKRMIDKEHKLNPGFWTFGYDLENMDKFEWECSLLP